MTDLGRPDVRSPKRAEAWARKAFRKAGSIATEGNRTIRFAVGTATTSSVTDIPAGSIILSASLDVTTPYSAGATLEVGNAGDATLLQASGDNDPQASNLYAAPQDTSWGGSSAPVLVTVSGAPAAGAAECIIVYTIQPDP